MSKTTIFGIVSLLAVGMILSSPLTAFAAVLQQPADYLDLEKTIVKIKQGPNCIVEGADEIPRTITDCPYNVNDTVLITYKSQQPAIEKHEIKQQ